MAQDAAATASAAGSPVRRPALSHTAPDIRRRWLSLEEASTVTGVSVRELYEALHTGDLPGSQRVRNAKWRVHEDDLDTWMRAGQEKRR